MNAPLSDETVMSIPAEDLKAVLPFKANQDIRYYLNGVLVEKVETGGCILVATNGHILVAMHSPGAYISKTQILAVSDGLTDALRKDSNFQLTVEVTGEKGLAKLTGPAGDVFIQPRETFIDGKYPEWRNVVPAVENLEPGLTSAISAEYLATLKRVLPPAERRGPISFWHRKDDPKKGSIVARFEGNKALIAVIMPMELKHEWTWWPSWMKREPAQESAAARGSRGRVGSNPERRGKRL